MNEKKKKKNEEMISVDEKPAKDVKMEKIIEKKFSNEKENLDIIISEIVDVKNLNAQIFIKYHINDTTSILNVIMKFFFECKSFLKKESAAQTTA